VLLRPPSRTSGNGGYRIGDKVKTGKTQTRLEALAARRVKSKIDAALRAATRLSSGQSN